MTEEEYQRIKRDPVLLDRLIREHCEQVAKQDSLPKHAPITGYRKYKDVTLPKGRDREEQYAIAANRLSYAIREMQAGRDPETPPRLVWSSSHGGTTTRGWQIPDVGPEPEPVDREPCGRCHVRADKHDEFGCKSYTRRLVA